MIDLVDSDSILPVYLKTFPVYFAHSEINKICVQPVLEIFQKLKVHSLFRKYRSLFVEWENRFAYLLTENKPTYRQEKAYSTGSKTTANKANCDFQNRLGYCDLEFFIALQKWIKYHKLHKYSYFFANLTYSDFVNLKEETIYDLETELGIFPITTGARGTILRRIEDELNNRVEKLEHFCDISPCDSENMERCLKYLKKILHTPIKKQSALVTLLETVITLVVEAILQSDGEVMKENVEHTVRVLQSAYSCYFFSHLQKAKFNTLRCRLNNIAKEVKANEEGKNISKVNIPEKTEETVTMSEDEILLRNLQKIEIYLSKLISS